MSTIFPLISCICITHYRPLLLQRALACFEKQDYPNKELIISYPKNDTLTKHIIDKISSISDIMILRIAHSDEENLQITKDNALTMTNGKFICTWNPNSWHNTNRLTLQYEAIKNSPFKASILTHITLFDSKNKQAYFSNHHIYEETLLCDKESLCSQEHLTDHLSDNNVLFHIKNKPYSYIYIFQQTYSNDEENSNPALQKLSTADEMINQEIDELTSLEFYRL